MISALARFVEALRREGLSPSPAEVLDATRAVDAVGVEDRARFRAALAATLAKGRRSRRTFDRVFDRFFVAPERARGKKKGKTGAGGEGRSRTSRGRPGESASPSRKSVPAQRRPRDRSRAEDRVGRLLRDREGTRRGTGRLRRVLGSRRPDVEGPTPGAAAERDALRTDLHRPLGTEEERRLAEEVPRLIRSVRLRSGRRFRRSVRGRPWPQRVFRENLGSEGVPFVLPSRVARPRKSRVVLLVDVSWSTAAAAGYFLWMASAFLALGRQVRVFAFIDRPVEVTSRLGAWVRGGSHAETSEPRRRRLPGTGIRPAGVSFASFLDRVPGIDLNAPSDYGRVFYDLHAGTVRLRGRDTVLVVLGDGRTNRFDPLPWAFEELSRRSRVVVWMVPEPARRWGTGDSALGHYLPWTDVAVEARDLEGLGRGLVEVLRRL